MIIISPAHIEGAAVGFIVGAFMPKIGRKIKAGFVAIAGKIVAAAKAEEAKIEAKLVADGQAAIAAAEKKV